MIRFILKNNLDTWWKDLPTDGDDGIDHGLDKFDKPLIVQFIRL